MAMGADAGVLAGTATTSAAGGVTTAGILCSALRASTWCLDRHAHACLAMRGHMPAPCMHTPLLGMPQRCSERVTHMRWLGTSAAAMLQQQGEPPETATAATGTAGKQVHAGLQRPVTGKRGISLDLLAVDNESDASRLGGGDDRGQQADLQRHQRLGLRADGDDLDGCRSGCQHASAAGRLRLLVTLAAPSCQLAYGTPANTCEQPRPHSFMQLAPLVPAVLPASPTRVARWGRVLGCAAVHAALGRRSHALTEGEGEAGAAVAGARGVATRPSQSRSPAGVGAKLPAAGTPAAGLHHRRVRAVHRGWAGPGHGRQLEQSQCPRRLLLRARHAAQAAQAAGRACGGRTADHGEAASHAQGRRQGDGLQDGQQLLGCASLHHVLQPQRDVSLRANLCHMTSQQAIMHKGRVGRLSAAACLHASCCLLPCEHPLLAPCHSALAAGLRKSRMVAGGQACLELAGCERHIDGVAQGQGAVRA